MIQAVEKSNPDFSPAPGIASTPGLEHSSQPAAAINVLYVVDQLSVLGGGERAMIRMIQEHSPRFRCQVVTFRNDIHPEVRKRLSVPIHVIPLVRTYSLQGIIAARSLRRFMLAQQIDIVHTFFETSDLFAGIVARLAGVKALISSRRDMGLLRSRKHRIAYRLVGRLCGRVLTVSEAVRRQVLSADRLKPNRVTTLYTGIHLHKTRSAALEPDFRSKLQIPRGAPIVLCVANILPWKGHADFLRAAALVNQAVREAHFVIAGAPNDASLYAALHSLRDSLLLGQRVHFLGEVDHVNALYRDASVFCLLSQTEGLPNVVLEAMAAGVPVVATNTGGTSEVVVHGETGFLTHVGRPDEAAECIARLLLSPDLSSRMSLSARRRVESVFSIERMMSTLEEIYDSSLAKQ